MKVNGFSSSYSLNNCAKTEQNAPKVLSAHKYTYAGSEKGSAPATIPLGIYNAINFTGGYSINLAHTVDKLSETVYPPDIRDLAIETVGAGNLEDKTLIDIHKEKYGKILQMETLDEVKAAYPEFRDVLSDTEIAYAKGSFIDDVKRDKVEAFDPDVDLALQLLQMYWAEGFSLNDLKEYTDGKNIFGVLEKLNIPRLNPTYGSVLKLSDKEYNARITGMMSERQKEAAVRRAEKRDGIYIPRGPLTNEHKKKISEGLIKHYGEHPEKGLAISERMKKYWQDHPEELERLSLVVTTAWTLPESKSIRKKLSKFMGKKDITPEEFVKMLNEERTGEVIVKRPTLKSFWDRNVWAKEQWSKCMKKAWSKVKNDEKMSLEPDYKIKIYPDAVKDNMLRWLRANGYDLSKFSDDNFMALQYGKRPVPEPTESNKYVGSAITAYFDADDKRSDLMADVYHVGVIKTLNELNESLSSPKCDLKTAEPRKALLQAGLMLLYDSKAGKLNTFNTDEAMNIYLRLAMYSYNKGDVEVFNMLENNIESAYEILSTNSSELNKISSKLEFLLYKYGMIIKRPARTPV